MSKTIIVSNRLPVKITEKDGEKTYKSSEGGLATGLGSIYKEGENQWIGWPGLATHDVSDEGQIVEELAKDHMVPVFLTEKEIEDFYEGFSNETLWPNFHYFNQYAVYEDDLWEAYRHVNRKFANKVIEIAEPGDTIWVHDYQLLLLPKLVRDRVPDSTIGFFLHIPFPSYESFRLLPWRRDLLNGMLGSDLVAFHTYDDMRHFLSSVNRLAGLPNENGRIIVESRIVMAESMPMGIDYNKYADSAASPETEERLGRYIASIGDVPLMLSIDRLDYSKGIPQRLRAFELFLDTYPEFREKVSLLMIVVPSRDTVPKYKALKDEIELLVGRINGKFGRINWSPVHYFYRSFPLPALSAFYRLAQVALVTPMRDGMNLVCKEFIASKLDKKGVLVLSEMAGASKELSDAIIINPNNLNQLAEAMHRALVMPPDEQEARIENMQKSLQRYSIHAWVKLFMSQLQKVKTAQASMQTKKLEEDEMERILNDYKEAETRTIFLDYDGTLVGFFNDPNDSKPDQELLDILQGLCRAYENVVTVISGRDRHTLENWIGHLSINIVAEHGAWIKKGGKFEPFGNVSSDWKADLMPVLDDYVNRTPGSFVEVKDYSLVWHYRKAETGLGEVRTRELSSHLKYLTANQEVEVLEGDMVVEIRTSNANKGIGLNKILRNYSPDFVMAIGDDKTDEDMFRVLNEDTYTIKVGSGASAAKYSVEDYKSVRKLLKALTKM